MSKQPVITTDLQHLYLLQRRITNVANTHPALADDPRVKQCLDRAYSGVKRAIEAFEALESIDEKVFDTWL